MYKAVIALALISSVSQADTNIISFLAGDGPSGIAVYGNPPTSTTTTSKHENNGVGNGASNGEKEKSTTTSIPGSQNYIPERGLVTGLQYQHRVSGGPLWLGILIQSNRTTSLSFGIGF